MLQQKTFCDVNVSLTELRALRKANETAIENVRRTREELITEQVKRSVPELTTRTFRQVRLEFPEFFLVREREEQFRSHRKILGFIKPFGYQRMLYLLQAQFHAFLEASGFAAAQDVRLRQLTERLAELNEQVLQTETVRLSLLKQASPVQAAPHAGSRPAARPSARRGTQSTGLRNALLPRQYEPGYVAVDDGIDLLDVLPLVEAVVMDDLSSDDGQVQSGACSPASTDQTASIATDDSLGCFS